MTDVIFSADDLRRRIELHGDGFESDNGDHQLNPTLAHMIDVAKLRDAAILIPVVERDEGPNLVLTLRTQKLRNHSGQVAFPGGRIDPGDLTAEHAALRETEEEIGLAPGQVEIFGRMPDYLTGSGYRISPFFGQVDPDARFVANPDEVETIFEVPLAFLMNPDNYQRGSRVWNGKERFFWTIPREGPFIWGITAGIIRTIYERFYA